MISGSGVSGTYHEKSTNSLTTHLLTYLNFADDFSASWTLPKLKPALTCGPILCSSVAICANAQVLFRPEADSQFADAREG